MFIVSKCSYFPEVQQVYLPINMYIASRFKPQHKQPTAITSIIIFDARKPETEVLVNPKGSVSNPTDTLICWVKI